MKKLHLISLIAFLFFVLPDAVQAQITLTSGTATFASGSKTGPYSLQNNDVSGAITLTTNCTFTVTSNITLTGIISGAGALTITDTSTGSLTLTGSNTYTGNTTVLAGKLVISGVPYFNVGRATTISSGATLELNNSNNTFTASKMPTSTISGAGTLLLSGNTTINQSANGSNGASLTFALTSTGLIDLQGTSVITNGGWQQLNWTNNQASLNIGATATFDMWNGSTVNVDKLTGSGTITSGFSGSTVLTLGVANGSSTFNGTIVNGAGSLAIVKNGTGTITLTGANTYAGSTTVNAGTLVVNGSTASSAVTLNAGSTLSGSGTVGSVSLAGGMLTNTAGSTLTTGAVSRTTGNALVRLTASTQYTTAATACFKASAGTATFNTPITLDLNNTLTAVTGQVYFLASGFSTTSSSVVTVINTGGAQNADFSVDYTGGVIKVTLLSFFTCQNKPDNSTLSPTTDIGSDANSLSMLLSNSTTSILCPLYFNGGTLKLTANLTTSRNVTLAANGGTIDLNGKNLTIRGVISGAGSLTVIDTSSGGRLTLTGVNTYTGGTIVNSGEVFVGSGTGTLGTGAVTLNGGMVTINPQPGNTDGNYTYANDFIVNGDASIYHVDGLTNLTGNITVASGKTLNIRVYGWDGKTLTISGNITGAGNVNIVPNANTTNGRVIYAGTAKTYTGATSVDTGIFVVNGTSTTSTITVKSGGVLTGTGTVGSVLLAGGTLSTSAGSVFTTGSISQTAGNALIKLTAATQYSTPATAAFKGSATTATFAAPIVLDLNNMLTTFSGQVFYFASGYGNTSSSAVSFLNTGGTSVSNLDYSVDYTGGMIKVTLAGIVSVTCQDKPAAASLTANSDVGSATSLSYLLTGTNSAGSTCRLYFNGGTLKLTGSFFSSRNVFLDTNGGTIDLNGYNLTLSGVISGGGGLTVIDTSTGTTKGVLTLSGSNTYTGATTITSGSLQISAGGISTSSSIVNNSNLIINIASAMTVSNSITGSGTLTKLGIGVAYFSSTNNNFTGGTTVREGAIMLRAGLGAGSITLSGGNIALRPNASSNSSFTYPNNIIVSENASISNEDGVGTATGTITIAAGKTLTLGTTGWSDGKTLTVTGVISGSGNLIVSPNSLSVSGWDTSNGGTVFFTANNTYTGTTTILNGTVQLGKTGATGDTSGSFPSSNIVNNGTMVFFRSDNVTVASTISGTGSIIKNGAGTLTLSGTNTYTGNTTVNGGTLIASSLNATVISGGILTVPAGASATTGAVTRTSGNATVTMNSASDYATAANAAFKANGNVAFSAPITFDLNNKITDFSTAKNFFLASGYSAASGSVTVNNTGNTAKYQTYYTTSSSPSAGVLQVTASPCIAIPGSSLVSVSDNTGSASTTLSQLLSRSDNSTSCDLVFTGGTLKLTAELTTSRKFFVDAAGGTIDLNGFNLNVNSEILGTGNLLITDTGTGTTKGKFWLNTPATISGTVTVDGGASLVLNVPNLDASTVAFTKNTLVVNSGVIQTMKPKTLMNSEKLVNIVLNAGGRFLIGDATNDGGDLFIGSMTLNGGEVGGGTMGTVSSLTVANANTSGELSVTENSTLSAKRLGGFTSVNVSAGKTLTVSGDFLRESININGNNFTKKGEGDILITAASQSPATRRLQDVVISAGRIIVNGVYGGNISVQSGGTLTGTGTVGNVILSGGSLNPTAGGVLTTNSVSQTAGNVLTTLNSATDYNSATGAALKAVNATATFNAPITLDINNKITDFSTPKTFYLTTGYATASSASVKVINTGGVERAFTITTNTATPGVVQVTITGVCKKLPDSGNTSASAEKGTATDALSQLFAGNDSSVECPLYFNGGTLKLTGNNFTIERDMIVDTAGGTIDLNGNTLTVTSTISGAGNLLITDTGTGTKGSLTLSKTATLTGKLTVDGGATLLLNVAGTSGRALPAATLVINNGVAQTLQEGTLGTTTAYTTDVTVNTNGRLVIGSTSAAAGNQFIKNLTLNGGEVASTGMAMTNTFGVLEGTISVTENSTISATNLNALRYVNVNAGKTLTISGVLKTSFTQQYGSFDKTGDGELILSGTSESTTQQNITLNAGKITVIGKFLGGIGAYNGSTITGTGTVGNLYLNQGSTLAAPAVGTFTANQVSFTNSDSHLNVYASGTAANTVLSKIVATTSDGSFKLHVLNAASGDVAATDIITGSATGTLVENTTGRCITPTNGARTIALQGTAPSLNALVQSICSGSNFTYTPTPTDGRGITTNTIYTWTTPALTGVTTTEAANSTGDTGISRTSQATFNATNPGTVGSVVYTVTAYTDSNKTCAGNTSTFTVNVNSTSAPVAKEATNVTATGYTANWNAVSGAGNYYVDVATDNAFTGLALSNQDAGSATSFNVSNLVASTTFYRVRARANGCTSSYSSAIAVSLTAPTLSAPTANNATANNATGFTANWTAVSNATGYELDVATDYAFAQMVSGYPKTDIGNVTNIIVTGLTANTTYYYRVRAKNTSGASGNSNVVSTQTGQVQQAVPTAPANVAVTNIISSGFTISWTASTGANGYRVELFTDINYTVYVDGYTNGKDVGTQTTFNVTGLAVGTYYVRVFAYNNVGNSTKVTASGAITITGQTAPAAPTANEATNLTTSGFTANWTVVNDATSYQIDVATNIGFTSFVSNYNNRDVGNVTTLAITGLNSNTTYFYRVRAVANNVASVNSNAITALTTQVIVPTAPIAPTGLTVSLPTNTGFTVSWTGSSDATGYKVEVSTSSSFSPLLSGYPITANTSSQVLTNLLPGHTYYVRVKAFNSIGESAYATASNAVVTGIEQQAKASVYPIPTQDEITLDLNTWVGEVRVQISSLIGITEIDRTLNGGNAYKLHVGNLSTGVYFVTLTTNTQKATVRIVKE